MKLLKSFAIYTVANFINRGISLLLAVPLSYFLSPADFGRISLFMLAIVICTNLMGLGAKGAVAVRYFQLDRKDFPAYFTAALAGPLIAFTLLLGAAVLFRRPIADFLALPPSWVAPIVLVGLFQVLTDLCLTLYRVAEEPARFARFNIGLAVANLGLTLLLVTGLGLDWRGRTLGLVLSYALFALLSLLVFHRRRLLVPTLNREHLRGALAFGLPLIPHLLGTFIIEYSDRKFIEELVSLSALGVYDIGYKFGMSIQMLVTAFSLTFGPYLFSSLENLTRERALKIVRMSYLFMAGLAVAVGLLGLISPYLFRFLVDEKFFGGYRYVFWVGLGYFFFGGYSLFANYIHFSGKTYLFAWLSALNVASNLLLNYFLIKEYGAIGAAYATILSYALIFIITTVIAVRLYPLPWLERETFDRRQWAEWLRSANPFRS